MDSKQSAGSLTGSQIAGGLLEGHDRALDAAGEQMLKGVRPSARFVLKRLPGLPAMVFDAADWANAPNKTRAAFGLIGGALGAAGGEALGAAAGGVNAPIGAAVGSAFGENLGDQIYDEHANDIDQWMRDRRRQVGELF